MLIRIHSFIRPSNPGTNQISFGTKSDKKRLASLKKTEKTNNVMNGTLQERLQKPKLFIKKNYMLSKLHYSFTSNRENTKFNPTFPKEFSTYQREKFMRVYSITEFEYWSVRWCFRF
jgi:hypothetical protein